MATGTRTALITGSGRNMGRGCAKELARAGFNIVINGPTKKADCERSLIWEELMHLRNTCRVRRASNLFTSWH